MFRRVRALDAIECRVLGSLLEKEQGTPEYYPMTVSALVQATNQKTNREPVMELGEGEVQGALDRLFQDVLVWRSAFSRSIKWSHNLDRRWSLTPATKAAMTVLLLRGAQTAGEIRSRSERLHAFASIADVEAALTTLAAGEEPLAQLLPRSPGQKESRWRHLVGEAVDRSSAAVADMPAAAPESPSAPRPPATLGERLEALERRVRALEARFERDS